MKGGLMENNKIKVFNKKGLSDVISTVLIVLLALAAIAIVWGFIQPTIKGAGTSIDYRQKCIESEVKPTACTIATAAPAPGGNGTVTVQYVKGTLTKAQIVVKKSTGGATIVGQVTLGNLFSTSSASIGNNVTSNTNTYIQQGDIVQVAPIVLDADNKDRLCEFSTVTLTC